MNSSYNKAKSYVWDDEYEPDKRRSLHSPVENEVAPADKDTVRDHESVHDSKSLDGISVKNDKLRVTEMEICL